jgi:GAF domain-containing protein
MGFFWGRSSDIMATAPFSIPHRLAAAPSPIEQEKRMESLSRLEKRYERLYTQLQELLPKSRDSVAHMATTTALLHHKMTHYFWTGFYLLKRKRLVVGPYQGPVACQVLEGPEGVCWAGVNRKETVVVPDVHTFPGHVACDSRSNSEIVVPCIREDGTVWAVLDVDSTRLDAFSDIDATWLEKITRLLKPEA